MNLKVHVVVLLLGTALMPLSPPSHAAVSESYLKRPASTELSQCIRGAGPCLSTWPLGSATTPKEWDKWLFPQREQIEDNKNEEMPFFPHRARTHSGDVLQDSDFDAPEVCGGCHTDIYRQWNSSVMSKSWDDPIYRALLKLASTETDGAVDNFCTGCHTPIGLTTGKISSEVNRADPTADRENLPGVDCESCHNMVARTGIDNGAYVLHPNASEGKPTKWGPRQDAVSPYHESEYSEFHTRSDFCGTCHNVTHPFSSTPIERTYDEWQESPYSFANTECQDCHMKPFKGKAAIMGPEREAVASHYFTGGNATLLSFFGDEEGAERSRDMLRSAGTVEILEVSNLVPGQDTRVRVKVSNNGAGHKLPTGFPEGREIWVDFSVADAEGNQVYRLGTVKDGATEPGTKNFKVYLGDRDGNVVDIEVWKVARVLKDNRILPMGYDVVEYEFEVPEGVVGPLTMEATLRYWPFPQKLVDLLLGEGKLEVQIVDIDTTEAVVSLEPISEVGCCVATSKTDAWPR